MRVLRDCDEDLRYERELNVSIIIHCGKSGYNSNELEMRSKICGRLADDMYSNKKLKRKSEVCGRLAEGMH